MTEKEIKTMFELMQEAKEGTKVNYAERQMDDGKYFGVSVISEEQEREQRLDEGRRKQPRHETY